MSSGSMVASLIRHFEAKNEESRKEIYTTSSNKIGKTEVTNTLLRSLISKSSSSVSSDSSNTESSSISDPLSSDLCLSPGGTPFFKIDESSTEELTLSNNSPCLFHDENGDIWVSLLDLDEEDSELIEVKEEQDFDIFDANFPSPSFNASSECKGFCEEELNKSTLNSDMEEPIFWPFDSESYQCPDLDKFLCVSPCRNMLDMDTSVKSGLEPIRVRLHKKNNRLKGFLGCERRSGRTATRDKQIPNMPSRLGRLSSGPDDSKDENLLHTKGAIQNILIRPSKDFIHGRLRNLTESSIEKSIGLHEFDGHEGIEEFGVDDDFPLCGSPWQA